MLNINNQFVNNLYTPINNKIHYIYTIKNVIMKEFVYFFKHVNVPGVKIGKTSGESVDQRFSTFKTYAPNGAINLGYFETQNATIEEQRLHQRFAHKRMNGEFFNITEIEVQSVLIEKIPNYALLVSEIENHNISLSIIKEYLEAKKQSAITPVNDFGNVLDLLPNKFTSKMAADACTKLGLKSRYFEIQMRKAISRQYVKKVAFGWYEKA